eukprot:4267746-Prymnesium_polylepis.1
MARFVPVLERSCAGCFLILRRELRRKGFQCGFVTPSMAPLSSPPKNEGGASAAGAAPASAWTRGPLVMDEPMDCTEASDEEDVWHSADEEDTRSDEGRRLSEFDSTVDSKTSVAGPADSALPQSGEEPAELQGPAQACLQLAELRSRCEAIVAHPDGGPRRSGIAPVDCVVDNALTQRIVAAAEATFKAHGEKSLRANCGNKLAKDETYGFVL